MTVGIDIRNVREDIVEAVEAAAKRRNTSLNETIVETLSSRYGVEHTPSGYPYSATGGSTQWNLRVSARLRDVIRAHAKASGNTLAGCVLLTVAAAYGLPPVDPRKRVPGRLTAPVIADIRRRAQGGESVRSISRELGVKRETVSRTIRG